MGVKEFYLGIEEKYYAAMDWLQSKGLGVYGFFVEPLESRGVPSFPVALLLFVLLFGGIFYAVAGGFGGGTQQFTVSVYGNDEKIAGATVSILDDSGVKVASAQSENGVASFQLPNGKFTVQVIKEGFKDYEKQIIVEGEGIIKVTLESAGQVEIPIATPTDEPQEADWTLDSPRDESPTASLNIIVRDESGEIVSGLASVYNADNNVLVNKVVVGGGTGSLDGIEIDSRVFANFEAPGYLPYNGESRSQTIFSGTNTLEITVKKATAETTDEATVSVVDASTQNALAGAVVNFYYLGGQTPVVANVMADANGEAKAKLENGREYYASADAQGYFRSFSASFAADDSATVGLTKATADSSASLSINVVDEETGNPVPEASVSLFVISMGDVRPLTNAQYTDYYGNTVFNALMRGLSLQVQVAKGSRSGNVTLLLPESRASVEANVTLLMNPATLTVKAQNLLTKADIPAEFRAVYGDDVLDSCIVSQPGQSCTLTIVARRDVQLQAQSPGFERRTKIENLAAEETREETLALYPSGALNDSYAEFEGFYNWLGQRVGSLMLGHKYEARFWMVSKNANLTGLFFKVADDNSNDVGIIEVSPPPAIIKANNAPGPDLQDAKCDEAGPCNWMEAQYAGTQNRLVSYMVQVDPNVQVDPTTHRALSSFSYRSWIARGPTIILRNPVDELLETTVDTPLASGYYANAYSTSAAILTPGTTCINDICSSLEFSQGSQVGPNEGFAAHSLLHLAEGDAEWEPLVVHYRFELFHDLGADSRMYFEYDPNNFRVDGINANVKDYYGSTANNTGLVCGSTESTSLDYSVNQQAAGKAIAMADLSNVKYCTNYIPYSAGLNLNQTFTVEGSIYLKPLNPTNRTFVTVNFTTSRFDGATPQESAKGYHQTWLSITNPNGAYTQYGSVEVTFEQTNNTAAANNDPWEAVSIADCTGQQVQNGSCHNGLVKINMAFTAQRARDTNEIMLRTVPAYLKVLSASYVKGGATQHPQVYEQGFNVNVGAMDEGETVTATAWAKPLTPDKYTLVTVQHKSTDSEGQHLTTLQKNVFVTGIPQPGVTNFESFVSDTCGGRVLVTFDPSYGGANRFRLGENCTTLGMRVSLPFPADAVPTGVTANGQLIGVRVARDDGSSGCYESCDGQASACTPGFTALTDEGSHYLRYNTELASCPVSYKAIGNSIAASNITVELSPLGSTYKRELNIAVSNYTATKSLYFGPVLTTYWPEPVEQTLTSQKPGLPDPEQAALVYTADGTCMGSTEEGTTPPYPNPATGSEIEVQPQLWSVANHKQIGSREIIIVEVSDIDDVKLFHGLNPLIRLNFDGPGLKVFAYYPHCGKRLVIYEKLGENYVPIYTNDGHDPVFETLKARYNVDAIPEFAEAYYELVNLDGESGSSVKVDCGNVAPGLRQDCEDFAKLTNEQLDNIYNTDWHGNIPYSFEVLQRVIERARSRANATAFWRSQEITYYCKKDCEGGERTPDNWDCCRPSVDDWRNVSVQLMIQEHPCVFCNNVFAPDNLNCNNQNSNYLPCTANKNIPVLDCDQRCTAVGDGIGAASVNYSNRFVANFSACRVTINGKNYDGTQPWKNASQGDAAWCATQSSANPPCPMDLVNGAPACFEDANGDGFRTFETDLVPSSRVGNAYYCNSTTAIISVKRQNCNYGNGKACYLSGYGQVSQQGYGATPSLPGLTRIDKTAVTGCFQSSANYYCPLELDDLGKPYCYTEYKKDGLFDGIEDTNAYGENVIQPSVDKGTYYECASGYNILVHKQCTASCDNWCVPRDPQTECSLLCTQNGTTLQVTGNYSTQTGWLGGVTKTEDLQQVTFGYAPEQNATNSFMLAPMKWFPELGTPEFDYHFVANTHGKQTSFYGEPGYEPALRVAEVTGCTTKDSAKYSYTNEWGVYDIAAKNTPDIGTGQDLWSGSAQVLSLSNKDYIGIQCRKPDDKWGALELCAPVYADYSSLYGGCINTVYQFPSDIVKMVVPAVEKGEESVLKDGTSAEGFVFLGRVPNGKTMQETKGCTLTSEGYYLCLTDSKEVKNMGSIGKNILGVPTGWEQKVYLVTPVGVEKRETVSFAPTSNQWTGAIIQWSVTAAQIALPFLGVGNVLTPVFGPAQNAAGAAALGAGQGALFGAIRGYGTGLAGRQCGDQFLATVGLSAAMGAASEALASAITFVPKPAVAIPPMVEGAQSIVLPLAAPEIPSKAFGQLQGVGTGIRAAGAVLPWVLMQNNQPSADKTCIADDPCKNSENGKPAFTSETNMGYKVFACRNRQVSARNYWCIADGYAKCNP